MTENPLEIYLKEINKHPLLTAEEEKEYAIRKDNGDEFARKKLIESNLRFVVNIAKNYRGRGIPFDDLISEGNIGLMKAVEKYDYRKGYHLISYAVWWIRQKILKSIADNSRTIRFPMNVSLEIGKLNRCLDKILSEEELPTIEKISEYTGFSEKRIKFLFRIPKDSISLENYSNMEDNDTRIVDKIADYKNFDIEKNSINSVMQEEINENLNLLTARERGIIEKRFGLNGKPQYSLVEIGNEYSLSRERVRQIEAKALRKLKSYDSIKDLAIYLEK